ncbi:hypothetical protein AMECASPLE_029249 [Ameca splendens]|uniref:Uncharacterized protein n=1 Tax=Ameca splendens TaxID=208324 RepID=A0ABV0YGZ8_9TELE
MQQQESEARALDGEDIEILPSPLLLEEMQWRCSGPFEAGARTTGVWTRSKLLLSISSMRTTSPVPRTTASSIHLARYLALYLPGSVQFLASARAPFFIPRLITCSSSSSRRRQ